MCILNFQRWKLPPSNFSMTLKDSIWNDDILLNTNFKTNTLCFLYSNEVQVGEFEVEKLVNVWRPHLKSLPFNGYMSQNKTFTRNPQTFEKLSCTNLKFGLKLIGLAKNSLWHTWNLNLSTTWKNFSYTSNFNVETFNNSKNSPPHTFSNFNVENLKNLKNFLSHFWT
jgi:hypothetical protein